MSQLSNFVNEPGGVNSKRIIAWYDLILRWKAPHLGTMVGRIHKMSILYIRIK